MVDTTIANYDPFIMFMGVVAALVFLRPFKLPHRDRVGVKEGAERETFGHYISEASHTYVPLKNTLFGITFNEHGTTWCGDKLKCCNPFDEEAWYHLGAICSMAVPFMMHFVYYFGRTGLGQIDDSKTDNVVWMAWGCGLGGAFICSYKGYFHDIGFTLATWITIGLWLLKTINVDWPLAGELALLGGMGLLSMLLFSACVFCGVCGFCAITCLTCKCCRDEISHWVSKVFLRFNMNACIAIAIVLGFSVPIDGIRHFQENDRTWLLNNMYYALGVLAAGYAYRLLKRLFCAACCYQQQDEADATITSDETKHLVKAPKARPTATKGGGAPPKPPPPRVLISRGVNLVAAPTGAAADHHHQHRHVRPRAVDPVTVITQQDDDSSDEEHEEVVKQKQQQRTKKKRAAVMRDAEMI